MANQRDPNKRMVGAYFTKEIKDALKSKGIEETAALEMFLIKALIEDGALTVEAVERMASGGELRSATILYLRQEGILLERNGGKTKPKSGI